MSLLKTILAQMHSLIDLKQWFLENTPIRVHLEKTYLPIDTSLACLPVLF